LIPLTYREALRKPFQELASLASKASGVRASYRKLQHHKAAGTWPPHIESVKPPKLPITKDFGQTEASRPLLAALDLAHASYRTSLLDASLELKKQELVWIDEALTPQSYLPALVAIVNTTYEDKKKQYQTPVWGETDESPRRNSVLVGWELSKVYENERTRFIEDLAPITYRLLDIEKSRHAAEEAKLEAKIRLKEAADVEMGDAATEDKAAADNLVSKVADALSKKYGLTEKVKGLLFDSWFEPTLTFDYHAISEVATGSIEEKGRREESSENRRRRKEATIQHFAESWLQQGRQEVDAHSGSEEADFLEAQRRLCAQVEKEVDWASVLYAYPRTYPDALLTIAHPFAIRYLLRLVPAEQLRAARFRTAVFTGPDVFIPPHLSIHISAGLRYLLFKKPNPSLLSDAYADFERRFKWSWHFETSGTGKSDPYDPDYDLHEESDKVPPMPPSYIENGLRQGQAFVDSFLSHAEPSATAKHRNSRMVWLTELRQYLDEHDYVITLTDKNLGAAVVKRDWIMEGARSLLSDTQNYLPVEPGTVDLAVDKIRYLVNKLTTERLSNDWLMTEQDPQLAKFLRSKIPESDTDLPEFPEFYVIPKIHKNPTGYRPIVPCYNNITEPASKVVSKMLKPLYEKYPTILKGTKDLALRLKALKLSRHRKVFIVTGDIVAYYPNIPVGRAVPLIVKMFMEYAREHSYPQHKIHTFITCLQIAVKNPLFIKFENQLYQQIRGVPMGAACSPDIANLYGAYIESLFTEDPYIPFFGRFIDDCLAIVYASSATEAVRLASEKAKYDGVDLTWSASEWGAPFLDMHLYVDPASNQIEHKAYRKPLRTI